MGLRLYDRYPLDDAAKVVITKDGYLTATPRVARTGVQLYYGSELGLTDERKTKIFKVFRPEEEVFATDSMQSFAYKPVTDDHPPENVTVDNWREHARGQMSGDVARDGQFIRVPMALMDGGLVKKYKDGKKELSVGYECEIVWGAGSAVIDGVNHDYDARQKSIRVNHLAVVDAARGGKDLKIGDGTGVRVDLNVYASALDAIANGKLIKDASLDPGSATFLATGTDAKNAYPIMKDGSVYLNSLRANKTDAVTKGDGDVLAALENLLSRAEGDPTPAVKDGNQGAETMKIITVDGVSVEVANDQAAQIIDKAMNTLTTQLRAAQDAFGKEQEENEKNKKKIAEDATKHATEVANKDAEIATLKKQVEDSKLTPAKLDELVKDRAEVVGKAKAILPAVVVDGKDLGEIKKQVVDARLGAVAKDWNAEQIAVSFASIVADVKPVTTPSANGSQPFQQFSQSFVPGAQMHDSQARIDARDKKLTDAWKPQPAA